MNLKMSSAICATVFIALSLPLAGCGNKGPLVLPPNPPPAEAEALPAIPPVEDATAPVEAVPEDGAAPPTPPADGRRQRRAARRRARSRHRRRPPATTGMAEHAPHQVSAGMAASRLSLQQDARGRQRLRGDRSARRRAAAWPGAMPRPGRPPYRRGLRPDPQHRTTAQRRRGGVVPHLECRRLAVAAMRQRRALHRRVAGARWRRSSATNSRSTARSAGMR